MKRFNWVDFRKDFKNHRFEQKDSLRVVTKETSVSISTISRLENGKKIDVDHILRLCEYIKKDLSSYIIKDKVTDQIPTGWRSKEEDEGWKLFESNWNQKVKQNLEKFLS